MFRGVITSAGREEGGHNMGQSLRREDLFMGTDGKKIYTVADIYEDLLLDFKEFVSQAW